ncbi:NIPSNAP family protein [Amycolatopsis sp. FDAARGOS 1241]|uniref:NIPSNAP family protein n=1 Tax=Amycolatopsis sp. FDAARGOS 1241 TaxID=2778070 RepID=UPI00194ECA20|nr:NIPSNAP family protein [Amycolatopsis sp. FDAARGOS 1241]QRP50367.1 NIPSNAP family protein [Amycolatopsis sp. FDAARGOS 1241]
MLHELREYVAAPGRAAALHARFAEHTLPLFAKHGLEVVGFWTDATDDGRLVYLLRFADAEAKSAAWAAFQADPEWKRVKAESEAGGPIVAEMHSTTLAAVPYWPAGTGSREQS